MASVVPGTVLVAKAAYAPKSAIEHRLQKYDILISIQHKGQGDNKQTSKWIRVIVAADIEPEPGFVPASVVFAVPEDYMSSFASKSKCPFCDKAVGLDTDGFDLHMLMKHYELQDKLSTALAKARSHALSLRGSTPNSLRAYSALYGPPDPADNAQQVPQASCDVHFPLSDDSLGYWRGIQGENNSCYIDALIFALFARTKDFDFLLAKGDSIPLLASLQTDIVTPLRTKNWVSRDVMFEWRQKLNEYLSGNDFSGIANEERDVEQFMSVLFALAEGPEYLRYYVGNDTQHVHKSIFHQIFITEKPDEPLPTTQRLIELSFQESGIKLLEAPEYLIVFMPRYGANFKLCDNTLPSEFIHAQPLIYVPPKNAIASIQTISEPEVSVQPAQAELIDSDMMDVEESSTYIADPVPPSTDIVDEARATLPDLPTQPNGPFVPPTFFGAASSTTSDWQYVLDDNKVSGQSEAQAVAPLEGGLAATTEAFALATHGAAVDTQEPPKEPIPPAERMIYTQSPTELEDIEAPVPRAEPDLRLEAMLTIERSHYVAWVRDCSKVLFFDSMSDRVDPINIPQVREAPEAAILLSRADIDELAKEKHTADVKRILRDLNMCIYKKIVK